MQFKTRDGVKLAYVEAGSGGAHPLLLVHGMRCNYTHMQSQMDHFSKTRRVVSVDLRGHGASDKPEGAYTDDIFNDDLVFLCRELGLEKPVGIGHSFGGSTLLHLAVRQPDFLGGLVLLDSGVRTTASKKVELGRSGEMTDEESRRFLTGRLFGPDDPADLRERILDEMFSIPRHAAKAMSQTVLGFDAAAAAEKCTVPSMFLLADKPFTDDESLARLGANWRVGKVVGAGHFIHMIAPDQVNAMIARFLELLEQKKAA